MKTFLFPLFILSSEMVFSQGKRDSTIWQKDIYEDSLVYLVFQKIIIADSVSITELKHRVKNWAGTAFVNPSNVLVSETEDQMVFNYSTKVFNGWYVRIIVSFTNGKAKIEFFDDGNTFRAYGNGDYKVARSFFVSDYFKKKGYVRNNGNIRAKRFDGILAWKSDILLTAKTIEYALLNGTKRVDR